MPRKAPPTEVSITPETTRRGRKPLAPPEAPIVINDEEVRKDLTAADTLAAMYQEAGKNALALATQLGYEGVLSVGALEDEIRFYQRRSVEAALELGKRLILLKELTPHGEFQKRIELLGIQYRMAAKFMAATLKFSNVNSSSLLKAAGTQTKMLELLVLDDGEIEALENGETVRGLTLDELDTMSVSELKAALREAKEDAVAKDRLLTDKNIKIDELSAKLEKKPKKAHHTPWPDEVAGLKDDLLTLGKVIDEAMSKHLTLIDATDIEIGKLPSDENDPAFTGYKTVVHHIGEQVERLCTLAAGLRFHYETRLAGYIELDKTNILPHGDED